jgi:hypothetical protein
MCGTDFFVRASLHCVPAARIGLPGAAAREPSAERKSLFLLLTQHLPLQRAMRASGRAGPTSRRTYGASFSHSGQLRCLEGV